MTALILVAGCVSTETESRFDRQFDFRPIAAFNWEPSSEVLLNEDDPADEETVRRLENAIARALRADGVLRDETAPDVLVRYTADARRQSVAPEGQEVGASTEGGFESSGTPRSSLQARNPAEYGILTIDMVHPVTGRTLWRGTTRSEIVLFLRAFRDTNEMEALVERTLDGFPPR
jgi:hypothetical protein